MTATAFDALATDYDATFTDTSLGRRYRNAVWRRVDQRFSTGQHVLEVNCGTGEDARHLAQRGVGVIATDVSQAMVDLAAAKLEEFDHASARQLAIEAVGGTFEPASFDGVLSNFGGLNCVDDLAAAAAGLAGVVRPGGLALVCLMGPFVPWEIAWYLAQRQPKKAVRRLRPTPWRGLTLRYPSVSTCRAAFAPWWRAERVAALGSLLPPPYAGAVASSYPRLVDRLDFLERRVEHWPGVARLADHYLIEFRRQ